MHKKYYFQIWNMYFPKHALLKNCEDLKVYLNEIWGYHNFFK